MIDYVLSIDTFEQQCALLKGMLQSPRLKDHVNTIGIDQSLRKTILYEQKFLQNINKLYKHSGKCDNQKISNILLRLLWFLLLKDSPITVPYIPWNHPQPRKQVLENHCVFSLTYLM